MDLQSTETEESTSIKKAGVVTAKERACKVEFDLTEFRKHFTPLLIVKLIEYSIDTHSIQSKLGYAERMGNKGVLIFEMLSRNHFVWFRDRFTSVSKSKLREAFNKLTNFHLQKKQHDPSLSDVICARIHCCNALLVSLEDNNMEGDCIYKNVLSLLKCLHELQQYCCWHAAALRFPSVHQ